LHLHDFILTEIHGAAGAAHLGAASSVIELRTTSAGRPNRHSRDNLATAVDDYDVIAHDEILVPAPLGINFNERRRNVDDAHGGGHRNPNVKGEVNVIDPGNVAASKHGLLDLGALVRAQRHVATSLTLLSLVRLSLTLLGLIRLTLLRLARLSLALLRRTRLGLALLSLIRLTLLTLRSLSLSLISLSALARGWALTLFALALTSGLIALSFTPLFGVALLALPLRALIALARLALALHALVTLVLLALFFFAAGRLARRLISLLFPLASFRLSLLILRSWSLVLRSWSLGLLFGSSLCIAALLLAVRASGTAVALSSASGLPAARHVLG
jgi:hypothetical protein